MFKNFIIIREIFKFIIPYILLYGVYVQINGEISPGGGFQAGVIIASAFIAFDLISRNSKFYKTFTHEVLISCAAVGILVYFFVGFFSIIKGYNYMNYSVLVSAHLTGQQIGICAVEIGVGITVTSVMCLIYSILK